MSLINSFCFLSVFKERMLLRLRAVLPAESPASVQVWPTARWAIPKLSIHPPLTPATAPQSMTADLAMLYEKSCFYYTEDCHCTLCNYLPSSGYKTKMHAFWGRTFRLCFALRDCAGEYDPSQYIMHYNELC